MTFKYLWQPYAHTPIRIIVPASMIMDQSRLDMELRNFFRAWYRFEYIVPIPSFLGRDDLPGRPLCPKLM